jgi:hypothetical protein
MEKEVENKKKQCENMEENKVMVLDFRFSLKQLWTLLTVMWARLLVVLQISETIT